QAISQGNQMGVILGEVTRNKALAIALDKAEGVDQAGNKNDLTEFTAVDTDTPEDDEDEAAAEAPAAEASEDDAAAAEEAAKKAARSAAAKKAAATRAAKKAAAEAEKDAE